MTKKEFEKFFVYQYSLLEKEFIEVIQYVAFESDNFQTYSNVFSKLLLQIGAEIDNLMKNICSIEGRSNIADYANILLERYPEITTQIVIIKESRQELLPYQGWHQDEPAQSLKFWNAYNAVKHNRIRNYKMATMENVSLALGGLYILDVYYCNDLYLQNPEEFSNAPEYESALFVVDGWVNHFRPSKVELEVPLMDDESGKFVG